MSINKSFLLSFLFLLFATNAVVAKPEEGPSLVDRVKNYGRWNRFCENRKLRGQKPISTKFRVFLYSASALSTLLLSCILVQNAKRSGKFDVSTGIAAAGIANNLAGICIVSRENGRKARRDFLLQEKAEEAGICGQIRDSGIVVGCLAQESDVLAE